MICKRHVSFGPGVGEGHHIVYGSPTCFLCDLEASKTRVAELEAELDKLRVAWSERGLRAVVAEARAAALESAIRVALTLSTTGEFAQAAEALRGIAHRYDPNACLKSSFNNTQCFLTPGHEGDCDFYEPQRGSDGSPDEGRDKRPKSE